MIMLLWLSLTLPSQAIMLLWLSLTLASQVIMPVCFSSAFLVFSCTQRGFRQPHTIMFLSDLERWDRIQSAYTLPKLLSLHAEMPDCSWLVSDSRHLPHSLLFLFFFWLVINLTWTIFAIFYFLFFWTILMISVALHCSFRPWSSCLIILYNNIRFWKNAYIRE